MAFLLDIDVLIARSDPAHELHTRARRWFVKTRPQPLLLCPLTENGFVRIYGHPEYPGRSGIPCRRDR